MDLAGPHPKCDATGTVKVGRLHMAAQTKDRVIGDGDGLFLGRIGQDAQHRSENFLLGDAHVGADA